MKQGFDQELEKAVIEYHECHRDKGTKLIKFVCNPMGEPLLLIRCYDEAGNKMSVLDSFYWDAVYGRWDFSDLYWAKRENERALVAGYMGAEEENSDSPSEQ